jgi:2-polyprenyl-6-methoxyphenol hydroxylase-like FAD-dependent oxidoreductase
MTMPEPVDVAVVGGSVAGLQAALTLGRATRSVAVIDDGHPRNAPARHVHNFLGLRPTSPAGFLAQARAEAIGAAGHGSTVAVAIHNALTTAELTASDRRPGPAPLRPRDCA